MTLTRGNNNLLITTTVYENIFPSNTADWFTHGWFKMFSLFLNFLAFCWNEECPDYGQVGKGIAALNQVDENMHAIATLCLITLAIKG